MEAKERPRGISILSVFHIAGGVFRVIVAIYLVAQFSKNPEVQQRIAMLDLPPALFVITTIFISSLAIASGIGMWKGRQWGWYLGSFYHLYIVARNANAFATIAMLMSFLLPGELTDMSRGLSYDYIKPVRIIVHFLLYIYFFEGNVRNFFSNAGQSKWRPILGQIGIYTGIAAVAVMTTRIMN